MKFSDFKYKVNQINAFELGGIDTQFKLAPKIRSKYTFEDIALKKPKKAAVLALFYPNKQGETSFLLTKRADYNGTHAAQISFPGGKIETNDISLEATALRETQEEVGIEIHNIEVYKQMTDVYIPPSNFIVTPFIGVINSTPFFQKNFEVAEIIDVLLDDLLNENSVSDQEITTSYATNLVVPCYKLNNYVVWGATAMMLSEIKELIQKL